MRPLEGLEFSLVAFFVWFSVGWGLCAEASPWQSLKVSHGIEVSRRIHPGQGLHEFRGVGLVEAGISEVLAIVTDIELQSQWVDGCISARYIEGNFPAEAGLPLREYFQVGYGVQDIPWPFTDRDYVIRSTFESQKSASGGLGSITVVSRSVAHPKVPVSKAKVRIPKMTTVIRLSPVDDGTTRFELRVQADPGGVIPNWIVNVVSESVPKGTIQKIRELAVGKAFRSAHLHKVQKMLAAEFEWGRLK